MRLIERGVCGVGGGRAVQSSECRAKSMSMSTCDTSKCSSGHDIAMSRGASQTQRKHSFSTRKTSILMGGWAVDANSVVAGHRPVKAYTHRRQGRQDVNLRRDRKRQCDDRTETGTTNLAYKYCGQLWNQAGLHLMVSLRPTGSSTAWTPRLDSAPASVERT